MVDLACPLAHENHLFCAYKGKPISDAAMAKFLDRAGLPFRPHGFRASFRTWATDQGEDWTLAERALAHTVGDETQRAYDRETALELRRPLMQRWADYVTGNPK